MKELNMETVNNIKDGFKLIEKFSYVDDVTPINLKNISLSSFYYSDDWLIELMRMLFINSSKKISHYMLDDLDDIETTLEKVSKVGYKGLFCDFLKVYGYDGNAEEYEDDDNYLDNYADYFFSLQITVLKLYSPLVCKFAGLGINDFVNKIPYLVGPHYDIRDRDLLGCRIEKDGDKDVVAIYYFNDDYGDLYFNIETNDTYKEFLNAIDLYVYKNNKCLNV